MTTRFQYNGLQKMKKQRDTTAELSATKNALLSFQKANKVEENSEEYLQTPPVRSKFRHLARDYQETLRMRMKRQEISGINKWVFKTSMKVVSQPFPNPVRQALKNNATLSKLKAYNQISSAALETALALYDQAKARIQTLLLKVEEEKLQNINLKKKLLAYDAKRNRTLFLRQKSQSIGSEIRQIGQFITNLQKLTLENRLSQRYTKLQINKFKQAAEQAKAHTLSLEIEIQRLTEVVNNKAQQLQKYSILRMPNHKEIVSCMFSIGILYEQIFVLDVEKKVKGKLSSQQLRQKQPIKDKQYLAKSLTQAIAENQQNRLIRINCKDSEIVVFKVLTVIYMHCRSLILTNLSSTMKKISYFSEEFKQIYHYKLFEKYIANLIQRNKGNQLLAAQSQLRQCKRQSQAFIRVNILTNEPNFRFLQWILSSFYPKDNYYALVFDKTEIQLYLLTVEHLLEKQKEGLYFCDKIQSKYTLRILLHDLEENY